MRTTRSLLAQRLREMFRETVAALRLSPLMVMALAGLAALVGASGLFALYALIGPVTSTAPARVEWRPPGLVFDPPEMFKPASEDRETLSRPIFAKSRRPSPQGSAAALPVESADPSAASMSLGAIVKFRDVDRALIMTAAAPEGRWLRAGEIIDGWTVASIDRVELTLQNGEQTVRLKLYGAPPGEEGQ